MHGHLNVKFVGIVLLVMSQFFFSVLYSVCGMQGLSVIFYSHVCQMSVFVAVSEHRTGSDVLRFDADFYHSTKCPGKLLHLLLSFSLRRADHSSRGVLPTVVRRCVWSRDLVKEEALVNWGLSRPKQTNSCHFKLPKLNLIKTHRVISWIGHVTFNLKQRHGKCARYSFRSVFKY